MSELETIRVLLVEDDEDDCLLARELIKEIKTRPHHVDWAKTYEAGLAIMTANKHDVCLVDYRLGAHTGIELLAAARERGCSAPIIILTGMGQQEVDLEAMNAGAADYLIKGRFDAHQLERTIRYAIERKRATVRAAFEQARLAAFGADVGLALTRRAPLLLALDTCAQAMVQYLNAALAQIWIYDPENKTLDPRAHAGPVYDALGSHLDIPVPMFRMLELEAGKPILIKAFDQENRLSTQPWARRQNLVSFAAQPIVIEDRLVGMMSLYGTEPFTETILAELASVASSIGLGIDHRRSGQALELSEGRFQAAVENLHEVAFQMNEFGQWKFLNPAWTALTGHEVKESLGKSFLDFIHPDDRAKSQEIFLQLLERKMDHVRHEARIVAKNGEAKRVEGFARLLISQEGVIIGTAGSINGLNGH